MEFSISSLLMMIFMYSLVQIQFNDNVLCQDQSNPLKRDANSSQKPPSFHIGSGYFFIEKNASSSVDQCGYRNYPRSDGDFPWIGAVLLNNVYDFFNCTGNLISSRHVLTAARCTSYRGQKPNVDELRVILGRDDIKKFIGLGFARYYTAKFVHVHPDYTALIGEATIGVITLAEEVQFNTFIRSICLWRGIPDLKKVKGVSASTVYNYRYTNNLPPDVFQQIKLSFANHEDCPDSHGSVFCAVLKINYLDGTLCAVSIGGAFMIERNRRWMIAGVLSKWNPHARRTHFCIRDQYMVFTDVSKFSNWIFDIIDN